MSFQTVTTTQDHRFLYNHIPQDILPDEYGGDAGKIDDLNGLYLKRLTKNIITMAVSFEVTSILT